MGRFIKQTFYDWCIETNNVNWLKYWDYEKNTFSPKEVGSKQANVKAWFKCDKESKSSFITHIVTITKRNKDYSCKHCGTFEAWCKQNDETIWLDLWDYEKNELKPNEISKGTGKKFYIKCSKGKHDSELHKLKGICVGEKSYKCSKCNSFGEFLIEKFGKNAIDKVWSKKNVLDPFSIPRRSREKVYINCTEKEYHGDFETSCDNFYKNGSCPYCNSSASGKHHILDSLGSKVEHIEKIWSAKNTKTPYDFSTSSGEKVWWKCECGIHKDYKRKISNSLIYEYRCPMCSKESLESSIQIKTKSYLMDLGYKINNEYECSVIPINPKTNAKLPFDNEVVELKLIVEVHGKQHYEELKSNNVWIGVKTPEQYLKHRRLLDRYKKYIAYKKGYDYLELPYWSFEDDSYKELINDKIKEITGGVD